MLQKELNSKETRLEAIKSLVAEKRKGWPTFKDEINIISLTKEIETLTDFMTYMNKWKEGGFATRYRHPKPTHKKVYSITTRSNNARGHEESVDSIDSININVMNSISSISSISTTDIPAPVNTNKRTVDSIVIRQSPREDCSKGQHKDVDQRVTNTYLPTILEQRKPPKIRRITNPLQRRQNRELSDMSISDNSHNSSNSSKTFASILESTEALITRDKYNWINQLRQAENNNTDYDNQNLIIMNGFPKPFFEMDWNEINTFQMSKKVTPSVHILPRYKHGQMYYAKGLKNAPHFSLNTQWTNVLERSLKNTFGIQCVNHRTKNNLLNCSNTVWFSKLSEFNNTMMVRVSGFLKEIGNQGLWKFYMNSKTQLKTRCKYLFNLGLTNGRVHCQRRIDLFGRVDLDLVSSSAFNRNCSDSMLSLLGQLLLYIKRNIFPEIHPELDKAFSISNSFEMEYVQRFAKQLKITNIQDLNVFPFQSISIIINDDIKPHCDDLNPNDPTRDYTFVITSTIDPISIDDTETRLFFREQFQESIPLTIVLYNRKSVVDQAKRTSDIEKYISSLNNTPTYRILQEVIDLFHTADSEADYVGNFFNKQKRKEVISLFKLNNKSLMSYPKLIRNEAPDKMGFWSSLLHMFLLFIYKNGLRPRDVFEYVLFFTHQCNTTTTIVVAMIEMCTSDSPRTKDPSLYEELSFLCYRIRHKEMIEKTNMSDVGSGEHPRFQTTNNKVYCSNQVHTTIDKMISLFGQYSLAVKSLNKKDTKKMMNLHYDLNTTIVNDRKNFPGIGTVRANHMICLASLLGLLPIEFYVNVPLHFEGGTGMYTKQIMGFPLNHKMSAKEKKLTMPNLLEWNNGVLNKLTSLFNKELTPNILENTLCILGRGKRRVDPFYFLPTLDPNSKNIVKGKCMQLCFRINGNRCNDWNVECNSGGKSHTFLSSKYPQLNRIQFIKNSKEEIVLESSDHVMNKLWIEHILCVEHN